MTNQNPEVKDSKGVIAQFGCNNPDRRKEYLNTKEAMAYLKIKSEELIYRWVDEKKLKAYRLGGKKLLRFTIKDLDEFIQHGATNE